MSSKTYRKRNTVMGLVWVGMMTGVMACAGTGNEGPDRRDVGSLAQNPSQDWTTLYAISATPITNGETVTELSGTVGEFQHFVMTVPEGATQLVVRMSGGTGDADLYARHGDGATLTEWACRPYDHGNDESCTIEAPAAGEWYFSIRGYETYADVSLYAAYGRVLANGATITGLTGTADSWQYFTVNMPTTGSHLVVTTTGSSNTSLFVRRGAAPTDTVYDCAGSVCAIDAPNAAVYHIGLRGDDAYADATLHLQFTDELQIGDVASGLEDQAGYWRYFRVPVAAGTDELVVAMTSPEGATGDADLYVRHASHPNQDDYVCRPYLHGNNETCVVATPAAGDWIVGVYSYTGHNSVTLSVNATGGLRSGDKIADLAGAADTWRHFKITVPANAADLVVAITDEGAGPIGDADLYVRYGSPPDAENYDCRPYDHGSDETCTFATPSAGDWHIAIRGVAAYANVALAVDYVASLSNGVALTDISGAAEPWRFYRIDVPQGAVDLQITTSGGTGDPDLYVMAGAQPELFSFDCRSWSAGPSESCSFAAPVAGTYYIGVRGFGYAGMSLEASYLTELSNGSAADNLAAPSGNWQYFRVAVPAGATNLTIAITGGTGDADLYVLRDQAPTTDLWQCRPDVHGNNETCVVATPAAGDWYIGVRGFAAYADLSLSVNYNE